MADIDEAGVRFVIEDLEKYLRGIKEANSATKGIGTTSEDAAKKHGAAVDKMQRDATEKYDKIGKAALKMSAVVAGAAVAVGAAALKIAGDFDDAMDTIQVGTGATGKNLEGLQRSFENVFKSIPANGGDIAQAMTVISQKTGATGTTLETLTKQVVELSRITKTDLNTNLTSITTTFQRWGVSAEAMPPLLDQLFRASQASGAPVSELADALRDNKGVIDGLKLSMPQAITLIGSMKKGGLDTEKTFGALRIAMTKWAKEGVKDPQAELDKTIKKIQNAGTSAEATAIGVKVFGRNSLDMVSAIRSGTFNVEKFEKALKDNKNGIEATARATDDWKEKLTILKNRALVELKPAAERVFKAVGDAVEDVQPALDAFRNWFEKDIKPSIMVLKRTFENDIEPAIRSFLRFLDTVIKPGVKIVFEELGGYVKGVVEVVTGIITTLTALKDGRWGDVWDGLKNTAIGALRIVAFWPKTMFRLFEAAFGDEIRALTKTIVGWIDDHIVAPFKNAVGFTAAAAGWMADLVGEIGSKIRGATATIGTWIDDYILAPFKAATGFSAAAADWMAGMLGSVRTGALDILNWIKTNLAFYTVDPIKSFASKVADAMLQGFKDAKDKVGDIVKGFGNAAITVLNNVLRSIAAFVNKFGDAINWISGNLGLGDLIGHWEAPQIQALRKGGVARGGLTLVGEEGPELVRLPRGARVYNADETAAMGVGGLPGWDDIKEQFESITDRVRDFISDILEKGTEWLIEKALSTVGVDAPALGGVFASMPARIFTALKDGLFDAVGGWVEGIRRDVGFATGQMMLPMTPGTYHVSQWYGKTPFSAVYPGGVHSGIDMATGGIFGTPIWAADGGKLTHVGGLGGYGLAAIIQHTSRLSSLYGHMVSALVKVGDSIQKGAAVGGVGSSGFSTGPHLHFEVRQDGAHVDPRRFVQGFARGGVSRGGMALVGEEGPELVMLPSGAMVVPTGVTGQLLGALSGLRSGRGGWASPSALGAGTTYNVTANYTQHQTPQSIRLDLQEIAMRASA